MLAEPIASCFINWSLNNCQPFGSLFWNWTLDGPKAYSDPTFAIPLFNIFWAVSRETLEKSASLLYEVFSIGIAPYPQPAITKLDTLSGALIPKWRVAKPPIDRPTIFAFFIFKLSITLIISRQALSWLYCVSFWGISEGW